MKNTNTFSLAGKKKQSAAALKKKLPIHPMPTSLRSLGILFQKPPLAFMQASVIVPAKDESAHILNTLEALRLQLDAGQQQLSHNIYEVLLLTNNCNDNTYALAKAYQQQHPLFQLHIADVKLRQRDAHIGTARRLLMDEALRRHQHNGSDGLILSTDGDTEVDARWITNTMREMKDCDALGGRILARNVEADYKLYYLRDVTYRCLTAKLEAVVNGEENSIKSSHFQCYGASLAVRCSAYLRAGRMPVIPCLEDEAFSRALYRVDARVKKSSAVKVYTSARLHGRVNAGLSVHLKYLGNMQKGNMPFYVESLSTLLEKYDIKKSLRAAWQQCKKGLSFDATLEQAELMSGISRSQLLKEINECIYFGECWEKTEAAIYECKWKQKQQPVIIDEAISDLRRYLKDKSVALT